MKVDMKARIDAAPEAQRKAPKQPAARRKRAKTDLATAHPVGEQIRDLRKLKGMTIPELAAQIGRSVGYVSQIERNISALSISSLQEICDALGVQIASLFHAQAPVPEAEKGFVVRKKSRRKLEFLGSAITEELLSPNLTGQIEMILTTIEPGGTTGDRGRIRRGEEAGYVIEGSVELWVGEKHVTLRRGDAFTFARTGSHCCVNPNGKSAVILWITTPPSY
jgi:transcriptional regulator with XRE-family HTH domain